MMATTAALSQRQRNIFPWHSWPHTAQAITIGRSSLTVIWTSCHMLASPPTLNGGPCSCQTGMGWVWWHHLEEFYLMWPSHLMHLENWVVVPFHQCESGSRSCGIALRRMWWCNFLATWTKSIIWQRNEQLGFTTLVACWISDKSSFFVHTPPIRDQHFQPVQLLHWEM